MPLTKDPFATPAVESASPSPVDPLFAPDAFDAWAAAFDRRMIARDAEWLLLGEKYPDICDGMAAVAARSVVAQPAIVWG
jgi:hypothetical protein